LHPKEKPGPGEALIQGEGATVESRPADFPTLGRPTRPTLRAVENRPRDHGPTVSSATFFGGIATGLREGGGGEGESFPLHPKVHRGFCTFSYKMKCNQNQIVFENFNFLGF